MSTTRMSSSSSARGMLFRSHSRGSTSGSSSSENLPPRTLARVSREIRDLHKSPPEGVRLVVDAETGVPGSLGEVLAEIEGPTGTPYESKFFQLKLVLSADFPASPPRGFFMTKIYHPNVDMSTGAICVNTLKKDWAADTTFAHVLSVIRCLLIIPFPESSLNDEAGKLFMESYDEYSKRALLMANVHGRPRPFYAVDATADTADMENQIGKTDGIEENVVDGKALQCPGGGGGSTTTGTSLPPQDRSNSLNRSNSSMSSSGGSSSKVIGKAGAEKKIKKKSLKRL